MKLVSFLLCFLFGRHRPIRVAIAGTAASGCATTEDSRCLCNRFGRERHARSFECSRDLTQPCASHPSEVHASAHVACFRPVERKLEKAGGNPLPREDNPGVPPTPLRQAQSPWLNAVHVATLARFFGMTGAGVVASPSKSTEEKKYDVALSFADEDRPYVDKVAGYLRAHRVRLFYDKYEEVGLWGKNLYTYLSEVYSTQAYYTVIFISKHYKEKVWTNHELTSVQERALREKGEYILPVRFDDTEIPGLTRTIGYLSLRDKTPEEFAELVRKKLVLEGLIADSPVTPPQPQNAAVGIAALPLAPTTEFVAEKGPPLNSRTAEPVSLPQQLAAQPPSLPAVIEQPQSTGGRKRVYAMLGLAGLCVGAVLGYLISQSSEESPVEPTPSPMARVQPSPQPSPDVRLPEPDVRSSPSPSPASPPPVRPTFDFASYTNYDIDGGDIRSSDGRIGFRNTDASGCEALCRDSPGCVAYSYDKWGGTCYPKDQVGALLLDPHYVAMIRSDLQAVRSSAATNSCLYRNKAMSGEVAGSSTQPSASSCKAECEGNDNCVAYTYQKAERRCSILNNVTNRPRDDPNAESGTRMQNSC